MKAPSDDKRSAALMRASLFGLAAGLLGAGWGPVLGGGLALGRIDPLFSLPGRVLCAVPLVWLLRDARRVERMIAGAAMLAAALAFDMLAQAGFTVVIAMAQPFAALAVQALALVLATCLLRIGAPALRIGALMLLIVAGFALPQAVDRLYLPDQSEMQLALLAGVPVDYAGEADIAAIVTGGAVASPIVPALAARYRVIRIDALTPAALADVDVLLLAHPKAMDPGALVDLDAWLRDGGKAVILADALSSWPTNYPFGDPRNPAITSLLTPLLDHWGLRLDAPGAVAADLFMAGKTRVRTESMGRFAANGPDCLVSLAGRLADCKIGTGRASIVADADLLRPDLWHGRTAGPGHWREGNFGWIAHLIDSLGPERTYATFEPVWIAPRNRVSPVPEIATQAEQARNMQNAS